VTAVPARPDAGLRVNVLVPGDGTVKVVDAVSPLTFVVTVTV